MEKNGDIFFQGVLLVTYRLFNNDDSSGKKGENLEEKKKKNIIFTFLTLQIIF